MSTPRRPVHRRVKLLGHEQRARRAIERVAEAVAVEMHQRLGRLALDIDVGQDHLVDSVEIPLVVRRHLIRPFGHAGVDVAREYRHRPLVVAGTLRRIPGRRIARSVIEQIERLVVAVPAPRRAAAGLPLVALPRLQRRVLADRLECAVRPRHRLVGIDQHLGVRPGAVRLPDLFARVDVVGGEETAHAPLTAGNAGDHLVLEDMRRIGIDRAHFRIPVLHGPDHFPGAGVESEQRAIGLLQEDLVLRVGEAPVDGVATHLGYHGDVLLRLVAPLDLLRVEIDGEYLVGKRRVHVHRAVHDQRRSLVPTEHAGGKHPGDLHLAHVLGVDLRQLAVALVVHVAGLHRPIVGVGNQLLEVGIRRRDTRKHQRQTQDCHCQPL